MRKTRKGSLRIAAFLLAIPPFTSHAAVPPSATQGRTPSAVGLATLVRLCCDPSQTAQLRAAGGTCPPRCGPGDDIGTLP